MEILENCDGLPLAIKVIGGLLSTRYPSEHQWKDVLNMPAWSLTGLPLELDNRLYLSYEDMSPQLKQCFLYCSLFPKGQDIQQVVVTKMWISEGFIKTPDETRTSSHEYGLEDIAIEYYQELIKRNLIEPTKDSLLTRNRCTMHDVVRSFAEYMVREESVVMVVQEQYTTGGGGEVLLRRLAVGQTISTVEWAALQRHKSLRTLIINSSVNFHPGDLVGSFSSLRVLYVQSANSNTLVPSLSKLKHLRYLHLEDTDLSRIPDDIHKMKFLHYIAFWYCENLSLPSSIIKLVHLRSLEMYESNVSVIPRGFGELTNLRSLIGFPVHMDMDADSSWCSLQELEPLSQLRDLTLFGLEKVHDSRMAEKATISSKRHLGYLELHYSAIGHSLGISSGGEAEQQQQRWSVIENVLEKLCPPTCIETLNLAGRYVGRQLPNWMCAPTSVEFKSLRHLWLWNLRCCIQLPDGLCCLPSLESLYIIDVPAVKRIGPQFQASSSLAAGASATISAPFPKLRVLYLKELPECEEWEWDDCEEHMDVETTTAMPFLEKLGIQNCKLSCLPPGLASSKGHALRHLWLYELSNLTHVESFPSVVDLDVFDCPMLKIISGLSMLQKIRIIRCPKLEVLEGVPELDSLELWDATLDMLPEYLQAVNPRYLKLDCNKKLHESSLSPDSSGWNKISHIGKRNINYIEDSDTSSDEYSEED